MSSLSSLSRYTRPLDTCGNVGNGNTHTTIFLAFAQFGYISWTPYVGGPSNLQYTVLKDLNGDNNWSVYHVGSQTQVGDTLYNNNTRYRVEATFGSCTATRSVSTVSSNIIARNITSVAEIRNESIKFFPNPAHDKITFSEKSDVRISNCVGQIVYAANTVDVDVSAFERGIYFVQHNGVSQKLLLQ